MKKFQQLISFAALLIALSNPAYSAELNELELKEDLLCSPKVLRQGTLNYLLTFEASRFLSLSRKMEFYENTLFVGTHFIIKRKPQTFNRQNLLKSNDIAKISESSITNFQKISENSATFKSSKELPFFTRLDCSNKVEIFSWNEFSQMNEFSPFIGRLSEAKCFDNKAPYIISFQEVFNCNRHFERSKVITLYFSHDDNQTRILNYSFSELSTKANFIEKGVIKREVRKSLMRLPLVIENLK